jgi:hypothetical protein
VIEPEPLVEEPEVQVVQPEPEPEVAEPLVVEPEPEPEPEPRRLVLDMTMAEPADDEVKESASEADDGSETRRPAEVDRVALTREFAQLFADVEGADES